MAKKKEKDADGDVLTRERIETKKPKKYRVVFHNDDYTPMDFVVSILKGIFHLDDPKAYAVMLNVHKKGAGTAGVYSHEIAETKMCKAMDYAKSSGHPLKCTMEAE